MWYVNKSTGELYQGDLQPGDRPAAEAEAAAHEANLAKLVRKNTIKYELAALDTRSYRALRELALPETGETAKEYARGVLGGIETQAKALRAELSGLGG